MAELTFQRCNYDDFLIQVPKIRVSSASESIRGTRKVSPGPKSADSKDQEEEQVKQFKKE